jgi:hypothetical protein
MNNDMVKDVRFVKFSRVEAIAKTVAFIRDFLASNNQSMVESSPEKGEGTQVALAKGGIVTGPTKALVGEAGPEAVIPLREFYAKMDELIQAVKQGQNIYIGPNKLNESIGLNLHSVG